VTQRLFPREIKKAFEDQSKRSASESLAKRDLLKAIALRAIPLFQDPLIGFSSLQQFGNFSSNISWSDLDRKIKNWTLLNLERPSADEMNHYLDALDKEFSIEEKTTMIVAFHLFYLDSMRNSLPETVSGSDLALLGRLDTYMDGSPERCLSMLEVDAAYRLNKEAQAKAFLIKYVERGMDKFLDVKAQVYPLRRYSVFKNFQSEMDGAEELLQSLIRGEKTINKETLDLKLIAFLIVFENFADAKEPAVWEWESDPDFDRLGQILKGTTANFDKAEKRWILENSQMYLQGVAAQNFEAGRGSRALNVATKNGAWAITLLSVQTVLWWAHARSLI
jgi:hypothetical protein